MFLQATPKHLTSLDSPQSAVGDTFPTLTAETLAGSEKTLPAAAAGTVTLITLAFERAAQDQIDAWAEPFLEEFADNRGISYFEVPMLKSEYKAMSGFIDGGMRGGIPQDRHDNVMTFYGDITPYRQALGMGDAEAAYVFLVDRNGVIQFAGQGAPTTDRLDRMLAMTRGLLNQPAENTE
jgi:hypothetical protein